MNKFTRLFLVGVALATPLLSQTWTNKRIQLPPPTNITGRYTPSIAVPAAGFDGQELSFYNPLEGKTNVIVYDNNSGGGEWGNSFFMYSPTADTGASSGAGTGWTLMYDELDSHKSTNGGLNGVFITSLTCSGGVATVVAPTTSAQYIRLAGVTKSDLVNTDIYTTWIWPHNFPPATLTNHRLSQVTAIHGTGLSFYGNLYNSWSWNDSGCADGTYTSQVTGNASIVLATPDEYPDKPMRRHMEGVAYDTTRNKIWMSTGIGDVNASTTVVDSAHSGIADLYSMSKTGGFWQWTQLCGFANDPTIVGHNIPAVFPNPGAQCGQQFASATSQSGILNTDGIPCQNLDPNGSAGGSFGNISVGGGTASCGFKFPYMGYEPTNDFVMWFGGQFNGAAFPCKVIMFYPATNTFKSPYNPISCGSSAPAGRWNVGASRLISIGNGKMFLFGGQIGINSCTTTPANCFNDTWVFQGCPSNNMAACGWTKINSVVNPPLDGTPIYDWDPDINVIVYVDKQQPSHTWFWSPASGQWTDQNYTGGPNLTFQQNGTITPYTLLGSFNAAEHKMVLFNVCSTATQPACSSAPAGGVTQIWTLDLPFAGSGPHISLTPNSWDFGNQIQNTTSSAKVFTLQNTGGSTLNITTITASTNFTKASTTCGSTLAVNATCTINATFTPTLVQPYSGTLTVTDTPDSTSGTAPLFGTGISAGDTTPPTISITAPVAGTYSGTLVISGVASDNVGLSKIVLTYGSTTIGTLTSGLSNWTFNWDTTPFAGTSGTLTATATDTSNNTGGASVNITVGVVSHSLNVPISVQEALYPGGFTGADRGSGAFTVGLPLPQGAIPCGTSNPANCTGNSAVTLTGAAMGQFSCLAVWPVDNSCQWMLVDSQTTVLAGQVNNSLVLTNGTGNFGGPNLAVDNGTTISVNTGNCTWTIRKANYVGPTFAQCGAKVLVDDSLGAQDGLIVMAHAFSSTASTWSVCTPNIDCTMIYRSANDATSTCSIEENGPVRSAVVCTFKLADGSGNVYFLGTQRLQFRNGKSYVQAVTSLQNANQGGSNTFASATKAFQQFEWRMKFQISSGSFAFGRQDGTAITGTLGPTDNTYLYQSQSSKLLWSDWNGVPFPFISKTGSVYAQTGWEVHQTGQATQLFTGATNWAEGWGNCENPDGSGVSIGHYQMGAYYPKSLQFGNGCNDVILGIWPDQTLSAQGGAISYYLGWPIYSIHDTWIDYETAGTTTNPSLAFNTFQSALIARANRTSYNAANVFLYPIEDPQEENTYWTAAAASFGLPAMQTITDSPAIVYRYYATEAGGNGNQADYRYAWMVDRWLGRGLPGFYTRAKHFYRMLTAQSFSRSDGFFWRNHSPQTDIFADGMPVNIVSLNNTNAHCRNQFASSSNFSCYFRGEHEHTWSLIDYYHMSGDRDALAQINDGYSDKFLNTTANWNTANPAPANCTTNCLPAGTLNSQPNYRSEGIRIQNQAHLWRYFADHGDTTDQTTIGTIMDTLMSIPMKIPCLIDANGVHYPTGCVNVWSQLSQSSGNDRGVSPYRGLKWDNLMADNDFRCASAVNPTLNTHCAESMMNILGQFGNLEAAAIRGPTWQFYWPAKDLSYAGARAVDSETYTSGPIGSSGTVYIWSLDQPNNMAWNMGIVPAPPGVSDSNGACSAPISYLWYGWSTYTGVVTTDMEQHFQHCMFKKWNAGNLNVNTTTGANFGNTEDFATYLTGPLINRIVNPPAVTFIDVPVSAVFNPSVSNWTVTWTPPANVSGYLLKSFNNLTILDQWPIWSPTTDLPLVDYTTTYNWFATLPTSQQPTVGASSITINGGSTLTFAMKAFVGGAVPPPPANTGTIFTNGLFTGLSTMK